MSDNQNAASVRSGWKNIVREYLGSNRKISSLLTEDALRVRLQFFVVYICMALISAIMTVMNIVTGFRALMTMTLAFSLINCLCLVISLLSRAGEIVAQWLFSLGIIALFTTFLIVGEPQGFSAIWITILPTTGMLLYRMKRGIAISLAQFVVLVFLLWTPVGRGLLQYEYSEPFLMRFPILYFFCFALGTFFEYIRSNTHEALRNMQRKYEDLSNHDALTGLYNRMGFNNFIAKRISTLRGRFGFCIMDLDNFKNVNDTYGHACGDVVLETVGRVIGEVVGQEAPASRWGGEEFAILFEDGARAQELAEQVRAKVAEQVFYSEERTFHVTMSCGLVAFTHESTANMSRIFTMADMNLYRAKNSGKNKTIFSEIET